MNKIDRILNTGLVLVGIHTLATFVLTITFF